MGIPEPVGESFSKLVLRTPKRLQFNSGVLFLALSRFHSALVFPLFAWNRLIPSVFHISNN